MAYKACILILSVFLFDSIVPVTALAQRETKRWYKGNLHTHTYWSDGDEYPEMVLDWYKSHGYDFIALSDHNTMAREEKWVKVIKSGSYENAFAKYLEKFGKDWVIYKTDSGRTLVKLKTYSEYRKKMEDKNFLVIPAEEITDKFDGKPVHLGGINLQTMIQPQGGGSVVETMQRNVDAVLKQRKETGVPMFPHINHPNFYYAITVQDMIDLHGERFFEVYNGHPLVHNEGDSIHPGSEQMWDMINMAYLKKRQLLLLGLATDDSHSYHQLGSSFSNAGRGWVMVYADALDAKTLINAMEKGDFYASTGVTLNHMALSNNELSIEVKEEPGVNYTIEFVGVIKDSGQSNVLKRMTGIKGKFKLTSRHEFVRARITSDKVKTNPYKAGEFEMAWTQPVLFQQ
ncbi:MAG TPA: histidinol-phosphatase [Chryseolinea sp.]|nr:histidinol-phosphatase [Chryseolinea sp.]